MRSCARLSGRSRDVCSICDDEDALLRLGFPKLCDQCGARIELHDDNWTRAEIMRDNRVALGPLALCSLRCAALFYLDQLHALSRSLEKRMSHAAHSNVLSVEQMSRAISLAFVLINMGHPIARGASVDYCVYCMYSQPVSAIDAPVHASDCVWEQLRATLAQNVSHLVGV
jgi:hypothetical protein